MKIKKIKEKAWFNGAVVACIGVAAYLLLSNLATVLAAIGDFLGYFSAVFLSIIFAYVINPVAKWYYYKIFRKMKIGQTRWVISVILAVITALLFLVLLLGTLLPQLVRSIMLFTGNFEGYADTLIDWIENSSLNTLIDEETLQTISQNAMAAISGFLTKNAGNILNSLATSGKSVISVVIAIILAIYFLIDKKKVLTGVREFVRGILSREKSESIMDFLLHCDTIMMSFLGQSILDALIVGGVNAIFMLICRMQYVGLVSVVVGVTNLIPNFGPAIGAVIGGFVLLLVNPLHSLMFLVFCVVLQLADGYILKPKLFANSLGVSGLLMLVMGIVLGNMFGILGILLSIPAAAILSFVYTDYYLPWQNKRRKPAAE